MVASDISERLQKFASTDIDVVDSLLTPELKPVLKKLVQAAQVIDEIYLLQVSRNNLQLREQLQANPDYIDALKYFNIMYGPWDRLNDVEPFIGSLPRPPGVGFYPTDLTTEEFEAYIETHPEKREELTSFFTVIKRQGDDLVAIPYSEEYKERLERAATLLEEAADLSSDERLTRYLRLRAQSFRTNNYFDSDVAWMELGDSPIEVVIGPYEVYEDELLGAKASFEAFITLRDPDTSARLARISELSEDLNNALPLEEQHRGTSRGDARPISVVYVLLTTGDTRAGVQTLAFNLPNDERVRNAHGYKLVILRNVLEAKYNMILTPIAQRLLHADQLDKLSFQAFLNNTLLHEAAHGLGPGIIQGPEGSQTTVGLALRDLYSTIEEAKADIVGLFASQYLIDRGELSAEMEHQIYSTFLAGFFRSVRFGASEAHGKANMIQFNYLYGQGAIERTEEGKYRVKQDRIKLAVSNLARELLTIEAEGNYERAGDFIQRYGEMSDELQQGLNQLEGIPVDIRPNYPAVDRIGL